MKRVWVFAMSGLMALSALAGCTGGPPVADQLAANVVLGAYPPWTLNQSPAQIALRWYPDATSGAAAAEAAAAHCGSWNKAAELVSDMRDGSAELAVYRCR